MRRLVGPLAASLVVVLCLAGSAGANNTGIFGKSGRDAELGDCTQCHIGNNGPGPAITVQGLDGPLQATGFTNVLITINRQDATGGIAQAACPDRCAGVGAALSPNAGAFVVPEGSPLLVNAARDELSHLAKGPFVNGQVTYTVVLVELREGAHTLFVAGNDVDGQDEGGDRVTTIQVPFTVGPPPSRPPDEPPGGCAQGGVFAPAAAALVALAFAARRRRR